MDTGCGLLGEKGMAIPQVDRTWLQLELHLAQQLTSNYYNIIT